MHMFRWLNLLFGALLRSACENEQLPDDSVKGKLVLVVNDVARMKHKTNNVASRENSADLFTVSKISEYPRK